MKSKIKSILDIRTLISIKKYSVITIQVTAVNISANDGCLPIKLYSYPLWFAFPILLHIILHLAFPLRHIINKMSPGPWSSSTSRKSHLAFCSLYLRPCRQSAQRGIELRRSTKFRHKEAGEWCLKGVIFIQETCRQFGREGKNL